MMAPPAINPDENRTPGPESASADSRSAAVMRRSMSHRMMPPTNIEADVEMGRYTPTATGSDGMPTNSMAIARNAPMRMSPHGSFWVRMPSTTSAMICAFG